MNKNNGRPILKPPNMAEIGPVGLGLAIGRAAQKCATDREGRGHPLALVIEYAELDEALRDWPAIAEQFPMVEMDWEADQRTNGDRVVLLFRKSEAAD